MTTQTSLIFVALAAAAVACGAASEASGDASDNGGSDASTTSDGSFENSGDGGLDLGRDASADARADAHANGKDGGLDASPVDGATNSPIGQTRGKDPCVRAGAANAPAWVATQRCNARTGRSNIVSTQSGTLKFTKDLNTGVATSNYSGVTTFAADGTIYAQGDFIAAMNPQTRTTKWVWTGGSTSPIVAPNGNILVTDGSSSPSVASLNPTTGTSNWFRTFPFYTRTEVAVLPNGNLAMIANQSSLIVLDPVTGSTLSTQELGGSPAGMLTVDADGIAYIPFGDHISAINVATQQVVWSVTTKARSVLLDEQSRTLYFFYGSGSGSRIGTMSAVDGTGLTLSTYSFELGSSQSPLSLGDDGWIYFYANAQIRGVNMQTQAHWEVVVTGYPSTPIVGGDGTLYVAETGSNVTAAAFGKTGTLLWRKTLGATTVPSSPGSFVSIAPTGELVVSAAGANAQVYFIGD